MNMKDMFQNGKWKKTPEFTAAVAAVVYGLLVHSFALNNVLQNNDNIACQPGSYGTGVASGRWFLEILGMFFDKVGFNYNLSSVNGMLYILLLAAVAVVMVNFLHIRDRVSAALMGALLVAFPAVTATMMYRFTAMFYGISALSAVLSVWALRRFRWGIAASAVLLALSMGIYQAYAPLTIALYVLELICRGLRGEDDVKAIVRRGLYDCLALILGMALYFVCLKICNVIFQIPLSDYRGMNTMGVVTGESLFQSVVNALKAVCLLPLQDYCGVANRALMRISYLLMAVTTVLMTVRILMKRIGNAVTGLIIFLLWVAFVLAVGFVEVMVPGGWIYTVMVYSFSMLVCAPLAVLECFPETDGFWSSLFRKAVSLLAAVLVCFYGYYANVNYTAVYYATEQAENYLSGVVIKATMTEGYTTDKQWAMIGKIQDPLLGGSWSDELSYTGLWFTEALLNDYSRNNWIENYLGYDLPMVDSRTEEALAASAEVQDMPCYPNAGSIKVIGDTVVVKFQNTVE